MTIDTRYIPAFTLEEVFLDKDTGAPLSGGKVYFEQDNNRGVQKTVYQISGTEPNYTFTPLADYPLVLSSIGTFEDALGNPIVPYFFPYDGAGDLEYYYVRVTSSGDVPQFARESVPYVPDSGTPTSVATSFTNLLSNPQFAEVSFDTSGANYVFNFSSGADQAVQIAPDWDLVVSCVGAATVTVSQETPAGTLNVPTNPGTLLKITNAGATSVRLRQRLYGSPNLWGSGFIAGSITGKTYSGTVTALNMFYSQSNGAIVNQQIIAGSLPATGYVTQTGSKELSASTSAEFFPDAYVDIYIELPLGIEVEVTSVMVAATGQQSINDIIYEQTPLNRQIDQLFNYYKPLLEYKPIASYLVGWDFPLNPAQADQGQTGTLAALGSNKSQYIWDQTIAFQSTANSLTYTRATNGGLQIGCVSDTSFAVIQYLDATTAREMLSQRLSVQLQGLTSAGSLAGTVSLYWTTDASLPVLTLGTDRTLVSSITAGVPAVTNGTWNIVPNVQKGNNASFTFTANTQTLDFPGFDASSTNAKTDATFFAIVVCFNTMSSANTVRLDYCSLVPGDIATRPAPQTFSQVLDDCEYYFEKSYQVDEEPGTVSSGNALMIPMNLTPTDTSTNTTYNLWAAPWNLIFKNIKRSATPIITLYPTVAPIAANTATFFISNAAVIISNSNVVTSAWTVNFNGARAVSFIPNSTGNIITSGGVIVGNRVQGYMTTQYTIDSRLGLV